MKKGKEPIMAVPDSGKSKKKYHGRGGALQNGKPGESSLMAVGKVKASSEDDLQIDELMESLDRHDTSFTALLSLIPANLYLAPESDSEAGSEIADLSMDKNSNKRKMAELTNEERKARIHDAKRAKYDPENQKNVIQIQQERATKRAERIAAQEREKDQDLSLHFSMGRDLLMNGNEGAGDTDEDEDSDLENDEDENDDGDSYETLPTSTKGSEELSDKPAIPSPVPGAGPPNILDLRARLQAKIQGIQAQRRAQALGLNNQGENGDDESIASTKDELLEERRKQRGEMRDRRRKAAKERKRAERDGTSTKKGNNQGTGNDKKGTSAPQLFVSPGNGNTNGPASSVKAVESNDLAFSSLQFDGQVQDAMRKSKHALPSDPKAALAVLEARKRKEEARRAKIEARSEDGDGSLTKKGAELAEKERLEAIKWSKAEAAAQGVKIRDDEALLRKAAKKRDKQKAKSSTEWSKRSREVASQQAARQKKRLDNIAARKDKKGGGKGGKGGSSSSHAHSAKSKALGSKRKSEGSRPGFEGKGRSFGGKNASKSGGSGGGGKKQGRR